MGPFGGVKGRDFLCVCALDGTLTFFEQETFMMESQLPCFLLPSPLVYVPYYDLFVAFNADFSLQAYMYENLANSENHREITPMWSFNIGESIVDIKCLHADKNNCVIVVLSEHNIFCFDYDGTVTFTKRLQYVPFCLHGYINETTGKVITIVASEMDVLLIYEETKLIWSAKLQVKPIAISIANFKICKGALVILSSDGTLQCCYLGTEPSLFIAPPLQKSVLKCKDLNPRLRLLKQKIYEYKITKGQLSASYETELEVDIKISSFHKHLEHCDITITLQPCGPIQQLHVAFQAFPPIYFQPPTFSLSSLCEKDTFCAIAMLQEDGEGIVLSCLNVTVIVSYVTNNNIPRVIRKSLMLPLKFVFVITKPVITDLNTRLIVNTDRPPVPLSTLFQEYVGKEWEEMGCSDEYLSFALRYDNEKIITIALCKNTYGYEFQCNSYQMLYLIFNQTLLRCKSRTKDKKDKITFTSNSLPVDSLLLSIDDHISIRNDIKQFQERLEKMAGQYRLIQRKLLLKLKDKMFSSLDSLQMLHNDTYNVIASLSHSIEDKHKNLKNKASELYSIFQLTIELLQLYPNTEKEDIELSKNALLGTFHQSETQGWEEITEAAITHLLSSHFATSPKDRDRVSKDNKALDGEHLKKLITTLLDRIIKRQHLNVKKHWENRAVSPIMEKDELEEVNDPANQVPVMRGKDQLINNDAIKRNANEDESDNEDSNNDRNNNSN